MRAAGNMPPLSRSEAVIWWATRRAVDPERFASDPRFARWLEDAGNAEAWERQLALDARIGGFASRPELLAMRSTALETMPSFGRRNRYWISGALAASLVLAIGTTIVASLPPQAQMRIDGLANVERLTAAKAGRRNVTMPDGSKIALNGGTVMETHFTRDRREIRLLSGQAFFHVAKDPSRPFIVAAGNRMVTATGTSFNVEIGADGEVRVVLIEGHVRVDPVERSGWTRLVPALAPTTELQPGDEFVAPVAGEPAVKVGDVEKETAWQRGLVILRDDRVEEALRAFGRASDLNLDADPRVAALRVSGVFPADRPEDFVAALENLYPVESRRTGRSILLSLRADTKSGKSVK
ncbi:FecR domain-containing protein [Sphingomonas sp. HITSZ_GF]|uniref:FecR family protein n=1 Tax=Sphingomonas sp. HITSZ_GF TaxID=3037247 RepID=UPI00240D6A12|nr:FecR domain-containing protein [Sphingomonas sp. HITSZ_GF]MDG2535181.1 FecR domain-containing protein [Sphingomonas sp. HITSZ_GF]